jgi:putative transposase
MYTPEQVAAALTCYAQEGRSLRRTVRKLGYPSEEALTKWVANAGKPKRAVNKTKTKFSEEQRRDALRRVYEDGESLTSVAKDIGAYSGAAIIRWKHWSIEGRELVNMPIHKPRKTQTEPPSGGVESLQQENERLRLEVDILKETLVALKKDPGVDPRELTNREKVVMIDALKGRHSLPKLLKALGLTRSSFYYSVSASRRPDKYALERRLIRSIFEAQWSCYGYRRVRIELLKVAIRLSEKVVKNLMWEEGLVVSRAKHRSYSSYLGELSPAAPNLVNRDFHAPTPNEKWLTDITEFAVPAGKVYLSAIIDCFDGKAVSWRIGRAPTAELTNSTLKAAVEKTGPCKAILHSDRGNHYRWPEWIALVRKNGLVRSMSKKGYTPDNAACEGFFGRMKNECFHGRSFRDMSIEEFIEYLDRYLHWYNEVRIKMSLGGMSPVQYRASLNVS